MTALPGKKKVRFSRAETRAAWLCLLPSMIGLVCITYLPMIASFALSLFSWNGLGEMKYIGLDNYIRLFTRDTKFYGSLLTTLEYAGISVIGSIVYSMIIAMLLNRKVPARGFFRAVFYLPYVLPALAVYLGWKWLYDYNHGLFNYLIKHLRQVPGFKLHGHPVPGADRRLAQRQPDCDFPGGPAERSPHLP